MTSKPLLLRGGVSLARRGRQRRERAHEEAERRERVLAVFAERLRRWWLPETCVSLRGLDGAPASATARSPVRPTMTTLLAASTFHIMYAVPAVALCAPAVGAFLVLSVGRILKRR